MTTSAGSADGSDEEQRAKTCRLPVQPHRGSPEHLPRLPGGPDHQLTLATVWRMRWEGRIRVTRIREART